jgi:hypothetical protein
LKKQSIVKGFEKPGLEGSCLQSYLLGRAEIRRIKVQGQFRQISSLHLQNNQSKTDWRCGSHCRGSALKAQSPDFKPQSHQKKKKSFKTGAEWGVSRN